MESTADAPATLASTSARRRSPSFFRTPLRWVTRSARKLLLALLRPLELLRVSGAANWYTFHAENGIRYKVLKDELAQIPEEGALITLSNQPYGDRECHVLRSLLSARRSDVKVRKNDALLRSVNLRGGSSDSMVRDSALAWLSAGHALALLPADSRSRFQFDLKRVADPQWNASVGVLIQQAQANVLPIAFATPNPLVCLMRWIPSRFRSLLRADSQPIRLRIGQPVEAAALAKQADPTELMASMRLRTYMLLGDREKPSPAAAKSINESLGVSSASVQPLATSRDRKLIEAEVDRLRGDYLLLESGGIEVICAPYSELDHVMHEIGRLRELTFRAVKEGTGKPLDISDYDARYHHMFMWHREDKEIVGGYRLGLTDEIIASHGICGLYSNRLFEYREKFFEEIGPGVELGRSFVQPKYQRSYAPLLLLWKGIGSFLVANPKYRALLGPVSISIEYLNTSKQLIIAYLENHAHAPELARYVRAKTPPRLRKIKGWELQAARKAVTSIEDLSQYVSAAERDHKGVPVMLKQYIKFGARMLTMNVDSGFADVLDGLMIAELPKTDLRVLRRYMGEEPAKAYLAHHGVPGYEEYALANA